MAAALSKDLGQIVVVDNRPGANTINRHGDRRQSCRRPHAHHDKQHAGVNETCTRAPVRFDQELSADLDRRDEPARRGGARRLAITSIPGLIAQRSEAWRSSPFIRGHRQLDASRGGALLVDGGGKLLHVPYKGSAPGRWISVAGRMAVVFSTAPSVLPLIRAASCAGLPRAARNARPSAPMRRSPNRAFRATRQPLVWDHRAGRHAEAGGDAPARIVVKALAARVRSRSSQGDRSRRQYAGRTRAYTRRRS